MRPLLTMWTSPRLTAWCLLAFVGMLALRALFMPVHILPYYLDFNPGIVLVPLTAVFWGPAGVWGCALGGLAGDLIAGYNPGWIAFRFVGVFLFGLTSKRLWDAYPWAPSGSDSHADRPGAALRFLAVSWFGVAVATAWQGLGVEVLRIYPYAYMGGLVLVHHLLFVTLLGLPFYRIWVRNLAPRLGTWREAISVRGELTPLSFTGLSLVTGGAIGACLGGFLVSGMTYRVWPFQPYVLGTVTGPLVKVAVIPFLLCHLVGLFRRRSVRPTTPSSRRKRHAR